MHCDQMVRISEIQKWFNTRDPINTTQYINIVKEKNPIILIDAKKVFNTIQYPFVT